MTAARKAQRTATATTAAATRNTPCRPRPKPRPKPKPNKHITPELLSLLTTATSAVQSFLHHHDLRLLPSQLTTLESLISKATLSLSSFNPPTPLLPPAPPPSPSHSWFHRLLSATTSHPYDPRWNHFFLMSKTTFSLLVHLLSPSLRSLLPSTPPDFALGAFLYRLAHAASYDVVSRRFGIDQSLACRCFFTVCKVINENLSNLFEFYSDKSRNRVIVGFGLNSLPNCCGVLGMERFRIHGNNILGKNGSILVQAVVDSEGRFLDVSAGWPSTLRPDSVLRKTKLFSGVEVSKELMNGLECELPYGGSIPQYVLGDGCFPLLPWLLTPYCRGNEEDSFSSTEKEFNAIHSRAMGLIEKAFVGLRSRWKLLAKRWKEECMEIFPSVIIAGCLLHNFLINCGEEIPGDSVQCLKDELPVFNGEVNKDGKKVRDALAEHMVRVSLRR